MENNIIKFLNNCISEENIPHAFLVETNNTLQSMKNIYNALILRNLINNVSIENNSYVKIIKQSTELLTNIINKDQILDLQTFLNTKAMDNSYKIYFILDAEFLNLSAANKLLKTIEEPGDKIIGFLLTSDINLIIPTIKSRCEIFKDSYETIFDEEIIKSSTILKQNLNKKYIDNYNYKKELMKIDKNNLILILKYLKKLYEEDLNNSKSISLVANKIKILDNIICMFYSNVSIELVLDKMFIELGN